MKSDTKTLIDALRILARDIDSDDGVANGCIAEAAERLEGYALRLQELEAQKGIWEQAFNEMKHQRDEAMRAIDKAKGDAA